MVKSNAIEKLPVLIQSAIRTLWFRFDNPPQISNFLYNY